MKIPQSRTRRLGVDLTPMIDVVFQLIIFFLVSSQMAQREAALPLKLPEADSSVESLEISTSRLTVNLREDGSLSVGGRDVLVSELEGIFAKAIEVKGEDVEVRIRASREAGYRHAEQVLLACTRQGIWNVTFAVYRREGSSP